ncbi:hypothetical protein D3C72_984210 [compost metagenome]
MVGAYDNDFTVPFLHPLFQYAVQFMVLIRISAVRRLFDRQAHHLEVQLATLQTQMKLLEQRMGIEICADDNAEALPCEAVQQTFHAIAIDDHRLREQLARWRSIVDQTVLETGDQRLANGAPRNAVHTLQQTLVALGGFDGIAFADDQAKLLGHFGRLAYVRRALLLIGVEQPRAGDATLNQRQFPDETHGITNTLAHALSKKRRGHVRGISKKEDSLTAPFLENQRMETVGRRTPDVVVVDVQPSGDQVPD